MKQVLLHQDSVVQGGDHEEGRIAPQDRHQGTVGRSVHQGSSSTAVRILEEAVNGVVTMNLARSVSERKCWDWPLYRSNRIQMFGVKKLR